MLSNLQPVFFKKGLAVAWSMVGASSAGWLDSVSVWQPAKKIAENTSNIGNSRFIREAPTDLICLQE
jgi:hypothetical protein